MESRLNILAIGYAKRALEAGSREQKRMEMYAKALGRYYMIVFTREKEGLPRTFNSGNLTVYGTHSNTKLGMLIDAYFIGRKILERNKDKKWIVSSQDPFETSLVGRALARAQHATHHVQLHGDNFGSPFWKKESLINRFRLWYGKIILKHASGIRVVSERIKQSLVSCRIKADKITVLPIRVQLDTFLTVGESRKFREATVSVTFLYVGRFSHEKNLPLLIKAFARVYNECPFTHLRLVGTGKEEQKLRYLVSTLGIVEQVTFIPWTNAVTEEMADADVFVLGSYHEGWSQVLIEAMAAGLPVVTTDVGCVGEVVKDGRDGLVAPVSDEQTFYEHMKTMATEPSLRIKLGREAHKTASLLEITDEDYVRAWVASYKGIILDNESQEA